MSASSAVAADPSSRVIGNVPPEIQVVQDAIAEVERQIKDVKKDIEDVQNTLKTPLSKDEFELQRSELSRFSVREQQLRAQLIVKEEQLRDEKKILLQKSGAFYAFQFLTAW